MVVHRLRIHRHSSRSIDSNWTRRHNRHVWLWLCNRLHVLRPMGSSSQQSYSIHSRCDFLGLLIHQLRHGPLKIEQRVNGIVQGHEWNHQNPIVLLYVHGLLYPLLSQRQMDPQHPESEMQMLFRDNCLRRCHNLWIFAFYCNCGLLKSKDITVWRIDFEM